MVKLRLRRKGRTHHPIYDIIAVDSRDKRDGAFLERLGYYDPHTKPSTISVTPDRAIYWLNNGAQATDMVAKLLSYEGVLLRRHLQFKGKSEEEIEAELVKHKANVKERYARRKFLRTKRAEMKVKREAEAKAAEEAAAAEAAAKEAAAKEATPAE